MSAWRTADFARKLKATCRMKSGSVVDLEVLDLSPGGCLVDMRRTVGEQGERVLVKLPGLAYQPATIAWVEDQQAGLAFEQALHEAVLDHLCAELGRPAAA